uniref:PGG domain-containing protein n=1 Tax=Nelumbo nucifera TaxID=4432 RepID=A0A822ZEP3_NELNU|nr:TPA_asm: hypothetical protein HUJ06_001587 [Nelumbo nucifera]
MEKQKSFRGIMEKQKSFRGLIEKQLSFRGVMEKQKSFRIAMEKQQSFHEQRKSKESPGKRGDSPFHLAARVGNLTKVREFLQECDSGNLKDLLSKKNFNGETALYAAAENGHAEVVSELLKYLDLETASLPANNCLDSFHVAAKQGHVEVLKELLNSFPHLAMTTDAANSTALHTASSQGHIGVVNLLLENDSNLAKIAKSNGKTALHSAARLGHLNVVKSLITKDPNTGFRTDRKGQTALHMAVKGHKEDIVLELIKPDPSVINLEDNKGNTALHIATTKGRPKMVRCLLSVEGINVNAFNKAGETALDIAEKSGNTEIASILKGAGATTAKDHANPPSPVKQLKQTVSDIKHDVQSQLQQSHQTGVRVQKIAKRLKKLHISGLNNAINSATVVAVLIATVAFAAIFTVPAVVVVQTSVVVIEQKAKEQLMFVINKLMWLACLFISVAFISLTYIVVGHHARWLAIYATVIGGSIMLTTIGSMCYCVILHRKEESNMRNIRRASESRSRSFSVSMVPSESELNEYRRMYAV